MLPLFLRKNIFSTYQKFRRYTTLQCLEELRKTQWLPSEKIKKLQWKRLEKLLKDSYEKVPYYHEMFDNVGINIEKNITISEIQKIPLLDKKSINTNMEKLISTQYNKSDLLLNHTGGSTGETLVFYNDKKVVKRKESYRAPSTYRNMEWLGINIFDRQAALWGAHADINKSKDFISKLNKIVFPTLLLPSYEMSSETMRLYADKINKYKPRMLLGYASALHVFAKYLKENKINIYKPKGIVSSAETLHPNQRKTIESVFDSKIFNRYGSREVGNIAQECEKHNGLHINAEHVYVEILDENGNPCNKDETGQIVITDLDNYGFPFIRYKIEDMGIISDRVCTCGRGLPLLEKVEGRIWDVIVGINNNRIIGTFWLVEGINGIKQFQVLQESFGEITIKLIVNNEFTEIEKKKLLKRIYSRCGEDMKVNIEIVDKIPLTKSGKHRFIISKVSPFINHHK